jgi:predicted DNA-binding transcriptional regulator AlpA
MKTRIQERIDKVGSTPRKEPASAHVGFESNDEYLTDKAVMEWLGVNAQWLADHRTRVEPIIPHVKLGNLVRYPRAAVQSWLEAQTVTTPRWERTKAKLSL